jgi:hypothetical protein
MTGVASAHSKKGWKRSRGRRAGNTDLATSGAIHRPAGQPAADHTAQVDASCRSGERVQELFKDFVGELVRPSSIRSVRRFLADRLTAAGLDTKIRRDTKVTVPVLQKEVEVPFGFQNGRFNLISPVRFQSRQHSVETACKYAVAGDSLYKHPDATLGKLQLIRDHESPAKVQRILDDHKMKLFRTSDLPQLIDEIRRTGKDLGPS